MESQLVFLDCPAYLGEQILGRCGFPAEVKRRYIMTSTDGPVECAVIRCPVGHLFNAPIEFLILEKHPRTTHDRTQASTGPAGPPPARPHGQGDTQ